MINKFRLILILGVYCTTLISCGESTNQKSTHTNLTAAEILGNPDYQAISFGAYRENTREIVPTVPQLKEDLLLLDAMDIRFLRTYNSQQFPQASNLLKAIRELKDEDPEFEMYVMLGAWIDAKGAWTGEEVIHDVESLENNTAEIEAAVRMANQYPDIVKVIAVGNEAMVNWATSYFVTPDIILKWVTYLQDLKKEGQLPSDLWVTTSDNFASWGGGDDSYHNEDLNAIFEAVDYVSVHTYPFHDTHYNPEFWDVPAEDAGLSDKEKADQAMMRALEYAQAQFQSVKDYMDSIGVDKPMHIGETGWASQTNELYGDEGSRATDEYKQKLYYDYIRNWTNEEGISCFYFEAFDEPWKDAANPKGSENHFGLFTVDGKAKYVLWDMVDQGIFDGLSRGDNKIIKTFNGSSDSLMKKVLPPPAESQTE